MFSPSNGKWDQKFFNHFFALTTMLSSVFSPSIESLFLPQQHETPLKIFF